MISLKKLIERNGEELFQATLDSYNGVLNAVGESGVQACPPLGNTLRQNLLNLQTALSAESSPELLRETGQKAQAELTQWGSGAAGYFKQRIGEVKELMMILARTAEATGERDQRYTHRFQEFTGRLQAISDLHDLAAIRESLVKSANDLKDCAEAMAEESQKSVARLREDVSVYQARLDDAERLAGQDPLTGLDNRRRVEANIEYRISRCMAFSVIMLDLNGFKQLNDTCGHLAGDDLLRQFSVELKSGFRATDVVGRLGGDEFLVVVEGGLPDANAHIERISRWVCGDYTVQTTGGSKKVSVTAAIGAAEWRAGDSMAALLERADAAMYSNKRAGAASRGAAVRSLRD